jgi:hypothetical protein
MSQPTKSSLHVFSGALIFSAALTVSACSDGPRPPAAPTAVGATASDPSHATTSSHGSTATLGTIGNSSAPEGAGTSQGTSTEPAAYNGTICNLVFPGTPSQTSETLAIWNIGHAILDVPFDTPRPDLYGILPGTMHQVPGYPSFDHDHIVSHAPGDPGYDGTWDVWLVVPGQNFDPATYQAPRSVDAMFTLIRSGVLAEPVGMAAAGFGRDLVFHAPLVCR